MCAGSLRCGRPILAPLLDIHGLRAGYGTGTVIEDLSLSVAAGEVLGLLGRNGVGKSTLLKTLMGLVMPRAGRILYAGTDIAGWQNYRIARHGIAYVPQGREIFAGFTVMENLRLGNLGRDDFSDILALFPDLAERRQQRAGALSGGQQQQLAIARALAGRPGLLLLDEPSEGVQPSIVAELSEKLAVIAREQGMSIILVEQNIDMALSLCGRIAFMEGGRIAGEYAAAGLRADPAPMDRFLGV